MVGLLTSWIFGNRDIKNAVFNKLGVAALFAAVTGFFMGLTDLIISVLDDITIFLFRITQVDFPVVEVRNISEILGLANHLFPFSEAIVIYTIIYGVWALVLIVRWVKSFVPTVAN